MNDDNNDPADPQEAAPNDDPGGEARDTNREARETIESLERERDDYYDRLLRKSAEFDNYRRRTERERVTLSAAVASDLLGELLPLVDDLERALKADPGALVTEPANEAVESYRRGVELILRQLLEVLRKRGVRPIDVVGTQFDPHFHQAVAYEPAEGRAEGEIVEGFRRGYMLGDKLLRPAMVKVAKAE